MADPKGIAWDPGTDIHLLPGDVWLLRTRLSVIDEKGKIIGPVTNTTVLPPSDFHVDFEAEFEATANAQGVKHAHGAKVERNTGRVGMDTPTPTVFIHNFLVRAELKKDPGNTLVGEPARLRVHCHTGLTAGPRKIWLTPSRLSIHKGADGQRFTVLAAFDDRTIGDISDNGLLEWTSDKPAVKVVNKSTGTLAGQTVGASAATITVKHLNWGTAATASAPVDVLEAWDAGTTQAPLQATFVAGPGPGKFKDVSNLLFVSEGFTANDRTAFEKLVTAIIRRFETDERTSPFDILSPQINYWRAFIAAPESGASDVNELFMTRRRQKLFGSPVPPGRMPPGNLPLNKWTLNEFIARVGLPVPAEGLPTPLTETSFTAWGQRRLNDWKTWYGFTPPQNLNEADSKHFLKLIREWAGLADRRLCNERNSALGIAVGHRPEFEVRSPQGAGFHPRRTTRDDFDRFLAKLTSPQAPGVGATWRASAPQGDDSHLVVVLISGSAYGGQTDTVIAVSLEARYEVELSEVGGGPEVDHVPYPVPRRPSLDTITTVAHETGHAFGLGDEYARPGSLNPNTPVAPLNLQDEKSLRGGNINNPLDASNLKWLWPRIDKARVLSGKPTPSGITPSTPNGKTWELPLFSVGSKPIRQRFKDGDKVRLRTEDLPTPKKSQLLKVSVNGASSLTKLIVESEGGPSVPITDSPNDFPENSIVYTPVFDQGGKELLLVHEKIQAHITSKGQPLNAPRNPPATRVCDPNRQDGSVQPATNWPPGLTMPSPYSRWQTIGAYEGGANRACGIYHPAGGCMMGRQILDKSVPDEQQWVLRFCAVCRYILVDLFDPSVHEKVDHWINRRYPR